MVVVFAALARTLGSQSWQRCRGSDIGTLRLAQRSNERGHLRGDGCHLLLHRAHPISFRRAGGGGPTGVVVDYFSTYIVLTAHVAS